VAVEVLATEQETLADLVVVVQAIIDLMVVLEQQDKEIVVENVLVFTHQFLQQVVEVEQEQLAEILQAVLEEMVEQVLMPIHRGLLQHQLA
jgi:hypothetical protein